MQTKLSKTEQHILASVRESHNGCWGYSHGYRTGVKKGSHGIRLARAAWSLRDKGLIKLTVLGSYRDCRSTYSDHWTEVLVEMA